MKDWHCWGEKQAEGWRRHSSEEDDHKKVFGLFSNWTKALCVWGFRSCPHVLWFNKSISPETIWPAWISNIPKQETTSELCCIAGVSGQVICLYFCDQEDVPQSPTEGLSRNKLSNTQLSTKKLQWNLSGFKRSRIRPTLSASSNFGFPWAFLTIQVHSLMCYQQKYLYPVLNWRNSNSALMKEAPTWRLGPLQQPVRVRCHKSVNNIRVTIPIGIKSLLN